MMSNIAGRVTGWVVVAVVAAGIVVWGTSRVDRRLDNMEDRLAYRPPADGDDAAETEPEPDGVATGRSIYVPVYSHVYDSAGRPIRLSALISIRNVQPDASVRIVRADYYDTSGTKVRGFLTRPRTLRPLETIEVLVKASDTEGGSGANVLVDWDGPEGTRAPLVDVVMQGSTGSPGISFVRTGLALDEDPNPNAGSSPPSPDVGAREPPASVPNPPEE